MKYNIFLKYFRIIIAFIGWIFLVISIFTSAQSITNYFSFFTIESNFIAVLWFSLACFIYNKNNFIYKSFTRGAIVVYLTVTMIVFFILLGKQFSNINFINSYGLHLVIPLAYLLDWLIDTNKQKIKFSKIFIWLIFPVLFCVYTLIRGKITNWYPYFFLSPIDTGSYLIVGEYIIGLFVFFMLVNLIVFFINNKFINKKKLSQ